MGGKYIGEQLRQAAELVGIPLERPLHTLRHSYARALRRVEAPLEAVQAALDHSNLATTSIYVRQLEEQEVGESRLASTRDTERWGIWIRRVQCGDLERAQGRAR